MVESLVDIFRFVALTLLVLNLLLLLPYALEDRKKHPLVLFVASISFYLVADWEVVHDSLWWYLVLFATFPGPFFLWLAAKSIFDDNFQLKPLYLVTFLGLEMIYFLVFFQKTEGIFSSSTALDPIFRFVSQLVSLVFVILALTEAASDRNLDLVEQRLRFRRAFIYLTSALVIITLLAEVALGNSPAHIYLEILHKASIAALGFYFSLSNLRFQSNYYFKPVRPVSISKLKVEDPAYEKIWEKLNHSLEVDKVYRLEGLTIGALADRIGCQEYKLRQLINRHLGYTNFSDFLNSHRIKEACQILSDPEQADLTILEIAYKLGYQSLAPFNRAFKRQTHHTPTGYRRVSQTNAD